MCKFDVAGIAIREYIDNLKKTSVNARARVLIWGVSPEILTELNAILQFPLALEPRKATSFIKMQDAPILSGLENSDFYFSEVLPRGKTALNYGMTGEIVRNATVLLTACNSEWQQWNNRPESSKIGSVYRSEMKKMDW
jgi:beta-galactosidase